MGQSCLAESRFVQVSSLREAHPGEPMPIPRRGQTHEAEVPRAKWRLGQCLRALCTHPIEHENAAAGDGCKTLQ